MAVEAKPRTANRVLDKRLLQQSVAALQARLGLSHDPTTRGEEVASDHAGEWSETGGSGALERDSAQAPGREGVDRPVIQVLWDASAWQSDMWLRLEAKPLMLSSWPFRPLRWLPAS